MPATAQKTMAGATMYDGISEERGLADGGLADGIASSDEMVALMNDYSLLKQSSTGGKSLMMGNNRDADGTIDRSPPPTEEVKVLLKEIQRGVERCVSCSTPEFSS